MEWASPRFPRVRVNWAGKILTIYMNGAHVADEDGTFKNWYDALDVVNNWRSAHAYPLNTFQIGLRQKARKYDSNAVVAQRTKRLWSIYHKLARFKTMQLSQIQDIGGCRAIVATTQQVYNIVDDYKSSRMRHNPRAMTDYIAQPRNSGYRGYHIIYEYFSDRARTSTYNGLRIEMQIRSVLQHAWATSVETIGTFTRQALKSSIGEQDWLRFFALMGTVIAHREGTSPVPGTPSDLANLIEELRHYADRVNAINRLRTIAATLQTLEQPSARTTQARLFLLELTPDALNVRGFPSNQQKEAQDAYISVEKEIAKEQHRDAVLVSVDSLASLRRAYPNYFLDTRVFSEVLEAALEGRLSDPARVDC